MRLHARHVSDKSRYILTLNDTLSIFNKGAQRVSPPVAFAMLSGVAVPILDARFITCSVVTTPLLSPGSMVLITRALYSSPRPAYALPIESFRADNLPFAFVAFVVVLFGGMEANFFLIVPLFVS